MTNTQTLPVPLKHCSKCNNTDIFKTQNNVWKDCYVFNCQKCGNKWYICSVHNKRFGIKSFGRMNKHFKQYHMNDSLSEEEDTNCTIISSTNNEVSLESYSPNNNVLQKENNKRDLSKVVGIHNSFQQSYKKKKFITKTNTSKYFLDEFKQKGIGVCGLVGNAFQISSNDTYAPLEESIYHLQLTNFLKNLTVTQQNKMMSLINKSNKINLQMTRIPKSVKDINCFYMKSKHSIYKNIPTPKVLAYDNHACVTIEDIIENVLSLGLRISLIKSSEYKNLVVNNKSLLNTHKTYEILKEIHLKHGEVVDPYVILLVVWSDDFEVNHTRKNKSSTWLKTVTFVHQKQQNQKGVDNQYTFALCLGNKKNSHFSVNKWYNEELKRLDNVIHKYSKIHTEFIPIVTRVLVMLADRPERCSLNDIASYSSNSTKRWSYSNGSDPHKMASCNKCFQKNVDNLFMIQNHRHKTSSCSKCCDFEFDIFSKMNAFVPPVNYPLSGEELVSNNGLEIKAPEGRRTIQDLRDGHLFPMKLTYDVLTNGLKFALFNHFNGNWSKKETIVYLKLLGMKDSSISTMIINCKSKIEELNDVIKAVYETEFPPMWSTILSLDQFIETPMHHLFEGLVKTVIDLLSLYLKYHKKWSKFAKVVNEILNDISSLHVGYCVIDTFSNEDDLKTGGWLAENYLGFSRIMVVIIGHLDDFIQSQELGFIEIQAMFQALFALLSVLMSDTQYQINVIENHIKIFLSICHSYEKDIGFEKNKSGNNVYPFWYNKSNFVSLLNLTKQIEQYGPIRLYWEGLNEKFIQKVKPLLKNKRTRVSYLVTKLEKMHRHNNFEVIVSEFDSDHFVSDYDRISDFQRFKSTYITESCLQNFESISGVVTKHHPNKIYIVHEIGAQIQLHRLILSEQQSFVKSNLRYYSVSLKKTPNYIFSEYNFLLEELKDMVIIIPFHPGKKSTQNGFTVISKNWQVFDIENGFNHYQPNINLLNKIISKNK